MNRVLRIALVFCLAAGAASGAAVWEVAAENGEMNRQALLASWRYMQGWLQFADPESGLLPRNLWEDFYWNAKDCAADNYPFMVLTTFFTDRALFEGRMPEMLKTEQRLCNRVGNLPDDYVFATDRFRTDTPKLSDLIFGASEYVKDGLLPMTEWLGPTPWADRMLELLDAVWEHAETETEAGLLPSTSHEVAGELMQSLSRMHWMTGREAYKEQAYRLAVYFFEHHSPIDEKRLSLDDHGCEVIGGLSEAYFLAAHKDPALRDAWRAPMHRILDRVLEIGGDENGMLYMAVNPRTGKTLREERTDNWGYNYNAFAAVGTLDHVARYHEAIRHVLGNLGAYMDYPWEGARPDGLADSLEGGLNLYNRYRVPEAAAWCDHTARALMDLQLDTGIFEGWYGDGNSARTLIMYALWKSRGAYAEPWRADVSVGAAEDEDGFVCFTVSTRWTYTGLLRFDVPRHREYLNMPADYARLNQFPEWFTAAQGATYLVDTGDGPEEMPGEALRNGMPAATAEDKPFRVRVKALE